MFIKLAVKMGDQFLTYRMGAEGHEGGEKMPMEAVGFYHAQRSVYSFTQIPVEVKDLEELAAQEVMDGVHISDISEEMASAGGALIRLSQGEGAAGKETEGEQELETGAGTGLEVGE